MSTIEPQTTTSGQDDFEIDLRHYFSALRRRLSLILAVTLATTGVAWVVSMRLEKVYEGVALLTLSRPETDILPPTETIFTGSANLNVLVESRPVGVLAAAKFAQSGIAAPQINVETVKPRLRFLGQDVTRLSVEASTPELAAALANAFASALVETDLNARRASTRNALRFIEGQVDHGQVRLARAETALAASRERVGRRVRVVTQPDGTRQVITIPPLSPAEVVEEGRLTRDMRIAEESYLFLAQKLQEARIKEASIAPGLRILQTAETPARPVRPRVRLNVAIALFLGLMAGAVLALMVESLDDRLRESDDVERSFNLSVLAELPSVSPRHRLNSGGSVGIVLLDDPHSLLSEAYRLLRTAVIFELAQKKFKTIMVTSPGPEQGKTTVSANLAVGLALAGKSTTLVEADLRRPQLATLFPWDQAYTSLLQLLYSSDSQPVLQQTRVQNLWWLAAGGSHPESTEMLASDQLPRMLNALKGKAEVVVIDTPPVLPVSDALILGRSADTTLLVVEAGVTTRSDLRTTLKRLAHAGISVIGVVMNKVALEPGQRYYNAYYRPAEQQDQVRQTSGAGEKHGENA